MSIKIDKFHINLNENSKIDQTLAEHFFHSSLKQEQ